MERGKIMDKTINKLKMILSAVGQRQVGHTTLIKKGIENYDRKFGVIAHNTQAAQEIIDTSGSKLGKAFSLHNPNFQGFSMPYVIDNGSLSVLLEEVISVMEDSLTYEEIRELTNPIMEMCEIYQERSHRLEILVMDYIKCSWWNFRAKVNLEKEILKAITEANQDSRLDEIFKKFGQKIK
jgi:AAA+ ATPase superfamily predicted ATPase